MNPTNKRRLRHSMKWQDGRAASGLDTIRVLLDLLIAIALGRGHSLPSLSNQALDEAFHAALLSFFNQITYGAERCMTKSTGRDPRPQALRRKSIRAYK
jgi:hypothetical protein